MGLDVSVGTLAWCIANGYVEDAEHYREGFRDLNRILAEHGFPPHIEPESLPEFQSRCRHVGMPYTWIHYLRRAIAYARQAPAEFAPVPKGEDPGDDPRVDRELSVFMDSHLICHSDADGYYVPIDFPEPIYDEGIEGGALGSSYQAMRELIQVAPLLGIQMKGDVLPDKVAKEINETDSGPYVIERIVWLQLFERFRFSIAHKTAVRFG